MRIQRVKPDPGQESAWNYPRPPRAEPTPRRIRVVFGGVLIADTVRAQRVLETSHPPTYYIPRDDVKIEHLTPADGSTFCEWKGRAAYFTVEVGSRRAEKAVWTYPDPVPAFDAIQDHLAFYASRMDACTVDGEQARPQEGGLYGGWITSHVVGPFKGAPGTWGW